MYNRRHQAPQVIQNTLAFLPHTLIQHRACIVIGAQYYYSPIQTHTEKTMTAPHIYVFGRAQHDTNPTCKYSITYIERVQPQTDERIPYLSVVVEKMVIMASLNPVSIKCGVCKSLAVCIFDTSNSSHCLFWKWTIIFCFKIYLHVFVIRHAATYLWL